MNHLLWGKTLSTFSWKVLLCSDNIDDDDVDGKKHEVEMLLFEIAFVCDNDELTQKTIHCKTFFLGDFFFSLSFTLFSQQNAMSFLSHSSTLFFLFFLHFVSFAQIPFVEFIYIKSIQAKPSTSRQIKMNMKNKKYINKISCISQEMDAMSVNGGKK